MHCVHRWKILHDAVAATVKWVMWTSSNGYMIILFNRCTMCFLFSSPPFLLGAFFCVCMSALSFYLLFMCTNFPNFKYTFIYYLVRSSVEHAYPNALWLKMFISFFLCRCKVEIQFELDVRPCASESVHCTNK